MSRQIVDDWLDGKISTDVAIYEGVKSDDPEVRVWALHLEQSRLQALMKTPEDYAKGHRI